MKSPVPAWYSCVLSPCPVGCHQRFADATGHSHSDLPQSRAAMPRACDCTRLCSCISSRGIPGVTGPGASRLQVWWQCVLPSCCHEKLTSLGRWEGMTFLWMDCSTLRHCRGKRRLCFVMFWEPLLCVFMSLILLSKKGSSVWEGFYNFCHCVCTNWSCLLVSGNRWCCPLFGNRQGPASDAQSLGRIAGNKLHLCFALGLVLEIGFVPNREDFHQDISHFLTSFLVNDLHLMQFLQSRNGDS